MLKGGGEDRIKAQHEKGKLSARERIDKILDEGSFVEHQSYVTVRATTFGMDKKRFMGDGVVTGSGKIGGKQVFLSSQDFTVLGGSLGEMHALRIAEAQELALKNGTPFIGINDSGGARIQEGTLSLDGYAKIFRNNTFASGVIPQLSVILGPCAGGAVYSPGITDFVFMVDGTSHMYITGPAVIETVTSEIISHEDLGGASAHCSKSGVAHFRFSTEKECFSFVGKLLSYLPSNNMEQPPIADTGDPADRENPDLFSILPDEERKTYDIKDIIAEVFDRGSFLEVHLRFCDSFNVPIISLVDVPGFLPGIAQEHGGIIRHGAKVLYAIAEATVPKISLILRKAYGGAYIAMSSKALGYDRTIAWPTAQVAVMGAEGAANIIFRRDIKGADNPKEKRVEKIEEFKETVMNPFIAAGFGYIDEIIDPKYTRIELIRSLEMNMRKREDRPAKKHGNIPL
jgi:acetyl-CoA carboxylase carboxyltransferase component